VDTIKIDKAFVRAIGTEAVSVAILPQIIAMARSMNLGVVVEGIESEGQADYFSTENIRIYGQGYLYGRPVPAREFYMILGLSAEHLPVTIDASAAGVPALGLASLIVAAPTASPQA
jgi:sensor c-di-GMP phosphodiesterase-like protein